MSEQIQEPRIVMPSSGEDAAAFARAHGGHDSIDRLRRLAAFCVAAAVPALLTWDWLQSGRSSLGRIAHELTHR